MNGAQQDKTVDLNRDAADDIRAGARWVRAALHVNPFGYVGCKAPSASYIDEDDYDQALIAECLSQQIEVIAVTDHWSVDSAKRLATSAAEAGITVFPGFEASSAEGKHLLVIFDEGTSPTDINAAIGACGATPGCANGTVGKPFCDILEIMSERGAMVFPAHANTPNSGLLSGRSGPPLVKMVTAPNLHAIAISPDQPDGIDQTAVLGCRPPYERTHPLSEIHADDICHADDLAKTGSTTYFKVSALGLDSFKLAMRTPATRVSLDAPVSASRVVLRSISWQGGLLDGVELPLSSELTTLIGGKGTGKSTTIESVRFALNIDPIGAEAKRDHKGIVSDVLGAGTTVKVSLARAHPTPARYTIQRSVGDVAVVKDANGDVTTLKPQDVTGTMEIYGQHELAELAQDKDSVARMLQRFAGHELADSDRATVITNLRENRRRLDGVEASLAGLQAEVDDIPRVEGQLRQYDKSDLPSRLKEQEQLRVDRSIIGTASHRLADFSKEVTELADAQALRALLTDFEGLKESPNANLLARISTALQVLSSVARAAMDTIESATMTAEAELANVKREWESATGEQRDRHQETLRQLTEEGLEPDKYLATVERLAVLRGKLQTQTELRDQLRELNTGRGTLLAKLSASETAANELLNEAVRKANAATGGQVVVQPVPSPSRKAIVDIIDGHISGARTQIREAINQPDFSPRAFVASARSGLPALEQDYGVRGAQAANLLSAGEKLFREIEEQSVGKAVDVMLDVAPAGGRRELRKLEDLSKGQKATALLMLLLGASDSPLIIDQPEDDLDNRFVYDGVVQRLRELKGKRQVIVSTHNANIPVLGDAELVIGLEGDGTHSWPITDGIGSLDSEKIRSLAEDLLEGGRSAFEARQYLYGF